MSTNATCRATRSNPNVSHPVRRAYHIITTAIMVVAIVLAVALVGVRVIGLDVYTVLSGSMEPTYHTGSVIYVKPCDASEVQVGDPITFVLNEDLQVATHRVIEIDAEQGAFYTKGDANEAADGSPVLYENLIGKPVFSIPYLGYLADYVQSPPGMYVAIAACAVLILLTFLPDLFVKDEEEESAKTAKAAGKKNGRRATGGRNYAEATPNNFAARQGAQAQQQAQAAGRISQFAPQQQRQAQQQRQSAQRNERNAQYRASQNASASYGSASGARASNAYGASAAMHSGRHVRAASSGGAHASGGANLGAHAAREGRFP